MEYIIEKVDERNYPLFEDMVFWRDTGFERKPSFLPIPQAVKQELKNHNLFIYAALVDDRYVGWISLLYMPKIGNEELIKQDTEKVATINNWTHNSMAALPVWVSILAQK